MKKFFTILWLKEHYDKIILLLFLILIIVLISFKSVYSPSEYSEENILADPVTESRGL
jgi:hypothetical protein